MGSLVSYPKCPLRIRTNIRFAHTRKTCREMYQIGPRFNSQQRSPLLTRFPCGKTSTYIIYELTTDPIGFAGLSLLLCCSLPVSSPVPLQFLASKSVLYCFNGSTLTEKGVSKGDSTVLAVENIRDPDSGENLSMRCIIIQPDYADQGFQSVSFSL